MFSYLEKYHNILDVAGAVSVIALIKLGYHLYPVIYPVIGSTEEILLMYFLYLCLIPVVIFTVSILLKKIINELSSESIALNKRISDLEKEKEKKTTE